MLQGTASTVGKSLLTAAYLRILKQDGYSVAPFKSQNMALNSFVTEKGGEMGRAQVMQAEAAGIAPDCAMNLILIKPTADTRAQIIVKGKVLDNMTAMEYHNSKNSLRSIVQKEYGKLEAKYDYIVIEGAGSPAEINLSENDLVNMGMAEIADAPVLLIGDIDKGGVFASL
ncbi:MAG: AAA family ATPase, partial [Eubacteriales bacterium]